MTIKVTIHTHQNMIKNSIFDTFYHVLVHVDGGLNGKLSSCSVLGLSNKCPRRTVRSYRPCTLDFVLVCTSLKMFTNRGTDDFLDPKKRFLGFLQFETTNHKKCYRFLLKQLGAIFYPMVYYGKLYKSYKQTACINVGRSGIAECCGVCVCGVE
jgi:hypothetical protein